MSDTTKDAKDDGKPSQIIATGRRKRAVARVRLKAGEGKVVINKKRTLEGYFTRENDRTVLLTPLKLTNTFGKFDVFVTLHGGGATGQAGAARLGISRALVKADQANYTVLKAAGFLTRDAREVERKKPGQAGARRSFQFSKR